MKRIKKIASLLLAMVMVLAMAVPTMATTTSPAPTFTPKKGPFTITIDTSENKSANVYQAYQIFKGDLAAVPGSEPEELILSNIDWGNGIDDPEALMTALKDLDVDGIKPFAECKTAEAVAGVLEKVSGLTENAKITQKFADVVGQYLGTVAGEAAQGPDNKSVSIRVNDPGYYLIQNATPTDKEGAPTSGPENFSYTRYILEVVGNIEVTPKTDIPTVEKKVQEVNDTTGETSKWQDAADYDINDEILYQLRGTMPSTLGDYDSYYYAFHDTLSKGLTFKDGSVKVYLYKDGNPDNENVDNKVDVTDSFTSSSNSVEGGNTTLDVTCDDVKNITGLTEKSMIVVEYTATLNKDAVIGSAGNPNEVTLEYSNNPNQGGNGNKGTTPPDKVTVFTFKLDVHKVDEATNPLDGAGFTLYKKVENEEGTGDDEYKEVKLKFENGQYYVDPTGTITEILGTDFDEFIFNGLDSGVYKLEETTTPAGYNTIDPIEFTVKATYDTESADPTLTGLVIEPAVEGFTCTLTEGSINATIKNQKGTQLPETGGIGTTIFYVVGGLLVVGAGVLLITKKRMSKEV